MSNEQKIFDSDRAEKRDPLISVTALSPEIAAVIIQTSFRQHLIWLRNELFTELKELEALFGEVDSGAKRSQTDDMFRAQPTHLLPTAVPLSIGKDLRKAKTTLRKANKLNDVNRLEVAVLEAEKAGLGIDTCVELYTAKCKLKWMKQD